jgi:hypothetical protein
MLDFADDGDFTGDPPSEDPPSGLPQCEVCGNPIEWAGRGRRPKRCLEHRTRTAEPGARKGRRTGQAKLDAISGDLQEGLGKLAGTIVGVAPVTAVVLAQQGPAAAAALVRIAKDHPRFLAGLEQAAKAVPFVAVGQFVAATSLALAVDLGTAEPHSPAGRWLGVSNAAAEVNWQPKAAKSKPEPSDVLTPRTGEPAPPRFAM